MRAQTARWMAGGIAAGSVALMAGGLALAYVNRHPVPADLTNWDFSDVFGDVVNLACPAVGFVLASRRPANRIGWLFLAAGLALGLSGFSNAYALHALVAAPGSLPAGRAAAWLSNWIFVIQIAVLALLLLLFPTGRLRSPAVAPGRVVRGRGVHADRRLTQVVARDPDLAGPVRSFGQPAQNPPALAAILVLLPATLLISVAALMVRFARSSGEERLQLKWFAAAAVLVVATMIPSASDDVLGHRAARRTWRSLACTRPSPSRS